MPACAQPSENPPELEWSPNYFSDCRQRRLPGATANQYGHPRLAQLKVHPPIPSDWLKLASFAGGLEAPSDRRESATFHQQARSRGISGPRIAGHTAEW